MTSHTDIRLETSGGTVIAYFAPNFKVTPLIDNDLSVFTPPDGTPSTVVNRRIITQEITVQGEFMPSDALPPTHKTDLENLFGTSPVSARDQVNRIIDYVRNDAGPFYLYEGDDEYTAETEGNVDIANGVYPSVGIDQIRPPRKAGVDRNEYTIKFRVGLPE